VLLPLVLLVFAEVALERLLAPGAVDWVGDWGKGRDGLVLAGVAEELDGSVRMGAGIRTPIDSKKKQGQNKTI
jgi:hypothetical protein